MNVIVIGAGAAGLTAAYFSAKSGHQVIVLEKTNKAGKKILMSGGTRCNVLPVTMKIQDYYTNSSKALLKRVFKSWYIDGCKKWLEEDIGINLSCEVNSNKWFPTSNSAKEVRDKLLNSCINLGVEIRYDVNVTGLTIANDNSWIINSEDSKFQASHVIIASGGKSIPTTGTTGEGYHILQKLKHSLVQPYAALTPLRGEHPNQTELSGISLNSEIWVIANDIKAKSNRSGFLFTHRGFSGPAILDPSHYAVLHQMGADLNPKYLINWCSKSQDEWYTILINGKGTVLNQIKKELPDRLAEALCEQENLSDVKCSELKKEDRKRLINNLTSYNLPISGHEGFRKAEVTGGGVPLEEINTATMESKLHPNLYICGELMDVFGRIGGFNFYWAWVSGRLAGSSVS